MSHLPTSTGWQGYKESTLLLWLTVLWMRRTWGQSSPLTKAAPGNFFRLQPSQDMEKKSIVRYRCFYLVWAFKTNFYVEFCPYSSQTQHQGITVFLDLAPSFNISPCCISWGGIIPLWSWIFLEVDMIKGKQENQGGAGNHIGMVLNFEKLCCTQQVHTSHIK